MSKLRVFFYTLKQGFTGLKKNILMILSSIYVIFVTLLLIGSLSLVSKNIQNELERYADKPEIRIDCTSEVTNADAILLMRKIEANPAVSSIVYITKEANLAKFLELLGEDSDLFQDYSKGAEAFYGSFDVKLKSATAAEQFVEAMYKMDGVEYVKDNISVVKTFQRIQTTIRVTTLISSIILGILSVFLVVNTIRLTVVARKESIEIEKYVGASHFYIEGPFVIEGIAIGLIGAVLSFLGLKLLYSIVSKRLANLGTALFTLMPFEEASKGYLTAFLIAGIAVGIIGSLLAIRKYEKEKT